MTSINWIGIGIMILLIVVGASLLFYYKRKVKELDGFGGILKGNEEKAYKDETNSNPS